MNIGKKLSSLSLENASATRLEESKGLKRVKAADPCEFGFVPTVAVLVLWLSEL